MRRLRFAEPVVAVAVSPDGTLLAVQRQAGGAGRARRGPRPAHRSDDLHRTAPLRRGRSGVHAATAACSSPPMLRRRSIAVVGWDARSGAQLFERAGPGDPLRPLARRPDDRRRHRRRPRDLSGTRAPAGRAARRPRSRGRHRPARVLARRAAARRRRGRRDASGTSARASASVARSHREGLDPRGGVRARRPAADHRARAARSSGRSTARPCSASPARSPAAT